MDSARESRDRGQAAIEPVPIVFIIVVIVVILVGSQVIAEFDESKEHYKQAEKWCVEHNGTVEDIPGEVLYNIECDLPNGTTVDPYQKIGVGYPPEPDAEQKIMALIPVAGILGVAALLIPRLERVDSDGGE